MPGLLVLAIIFLIAAAVGSAVWGWLAAANRKTDARWAATVGAAQQSFRLPEGSTIDRSTLTVAQLGLTPPLDSWDHRWPAGVAIAALAIAAVLTLGSSYNPVGTKEVGVETSFGKTVGHLSNGPHLTWPWVKVHEMDAAIQTDSYVGAGCINVRIANQQTGCANVSIQWRILPADTDELYKDYRSFDHVRDALVTRNLTQALNEALSSYNPLNQIAAGHSVSSPLVGYAHDVTRILRNEIGRKIVVLSTILPIVSFDPATQGRINQLQQQVALTRISEQALKTNEAQAKANAALARSVDTSPNVLVSRCIDALDQMVKQGQPVPPGFSCWPGGGVAAVIAGPTAGRAAPAAPASKAK